MVSDYGLSVQMALDYVQSVTMVWGSVQKQTT